MDSIDNGIYADSRDQLFDDIIKSVIQSNMNSIKKLQDNIRAHIAIHIEQLNVDKDILAGTIH